MRPMVRHGNAQGEKPAETLGKSHRVDFAGNRPVDNLYAALFELNAWLAVPDPSIEKGLSLQDNADFGYWPARWSCGLCADVGVTCTEKEPDHGYRNC